jgi:hypothetical protein
MHRLIPLLVLIAGAFFAVEGISHLSESGIGRWLALPLLAGGTLAIALSTPSPGATTSDTAGPALIAHAQLTPFFRGHLFDGFAPAAAVGLLIDRFPGQYVNQFDEGSWEPFVKSLLYFLAGAVVFAGIAWAAVFGSNKNDFLYPVLWCALFGGLTFPIAYLSTVRFSKAQSAAGGEPVVAPATVTATLPLTTPQLDDAG